MFLDKSLNIAFLISIFLHAVIFIPFPHINIIPQKEIDAHPAITYLLIPEPVVSKQPVIKAVTPKLLPEKKQETVSTKAPLPPAPAIKESAEEMIKDILKTETQQAKIEIPPELPPEKEGVYLSYYETIRAKIKQYVIKNYPSFIARGDVCVHFVLSANGRLQTIKVLDERSSRNGLLKEIAAKSVRQAAPFLPFPQDLEQKLLTFNVTISFELE